MSQEKLETRLREHRGTKDRGSLLEKRMQVHRAERLSQKEKQQRLDATHMEGRNEIYWDFAMRNKEAACRYDDLGLIELLEQRRARPAIALKTGRVSLDYATGGVPAGVVEIYGAESVGKTSLLIDMIGVAQNFNQADIAFCPSEFFDKPYFHKQGVDLDSMLVLRGRYGEDVLELAGSFITNADNRMLFLDSATGLRPKEDRFDNWLKMMLSWLEQVVPRLSPTSCIIMTNQVRVRRSVDPTRMFAGGTDSTAKRIAGIFDQRLELSREDVSEDRFTMVVNIVANTLKPPARFVRLPFYKGEGIDGWLDMVRASVAVGVLEKRGSWYYYPYFGGVNIAQGEQATAEYLKSNELGNDVVKLTMLRLERGEGTR